MKKHTLTFEEFVNENLNEASNAPKKFKMKVKDLFPYVDSTNTWEEDIKIYLDPETSEEEKTNTETSTWWSWQWSSLKAMGIKDNPKNIDQIVFDNWNETVKVKQTPEYSEEEGHVFVFKFKLKGNDINITTPDMRGTKWDKGY